MGLSCLDDEASAASNFCSLSIYWVAVIHSDELCMGSIPMNSKCPVMLIGILVRVPKTRFRQVSFMQVLSPSGMI